MHKRFLLNIFLSLSLTACVQLGPEPAGEDLKAPTLTLVDLYQSPNSVEVVFRAQLSGGITNEDCGFYLSKNENLSGSEKVRAYSKEKNGAFSYTKKMSNDYGSKWYVKAYASNGRTEITSPVLSFTFFYPRDIGAVDLGLSVFWASFNVGASSPEEYGGYYQWAGTQDVTSTSIYLDWNNCPYHSGSNSSTGWTKYIPSDKSSYWSGSGSPDNKTVLELSDDIAHVKLGGKWRMPTEAEWEELINNCTWTWTTQNGVNGYKVTGKKSAYTSKSIFLPAAGCRNSDYLYNVGTRGYYWSSSLNTGYPYYAYVLYFYPPGSVDTSNDRRYGGLSVRPVLDK